MPETSTALWWAAAGRRPSGRGPLSEALLSALTSQAHALVLPTPADDDPLTSDDEALALYLCYELHYRGLEGVDDRWEWEPTLLAFRRRLEDRLAGRLRASLPTPVVRPTDAGEVLLELASSAGGPSLSGYLARKGTLEEFREMAVHRSAYQLKEADPHSWGLPRLSGVAKAALVQIQSEEYGLGQVAEMHSSLFADTLEALELDPTYGAYLDALPGVTLTTVNLISYFGLHRRWRGALVGHLGLFEMTSVGPNRRYAQGLSRLGQSERASRFYLAHVEADAEHEQVALGELVGGLVAAEPDLVRDIIFGARALSLVEAAFSAHLLGSWARGVSSLRSTGGDGAYARQADGVSAQV